MFLIGKIKIKKALQLGKLFIGLTTKPRYLRT